MRNTHKKCLKVISFFKYIDNFVEKYTDTTSFILITVGGILATIAVGALPHGGTTNGYSFVYIKYPILLKEGLLGVTLGFVIQLYENLIVVHKLNKKEVKPWLTTAFILLVVLVLFN